MKQHVKRQQGFSLLEALTAIAILMIVAGMAIVNFSSVIPNAKANSAMDQMLYQLRSARARAIAHRREVRAARDKSDVGPGLGERGAIDAADPARPDDRNAHALLRFPLARHLP